MGFYESVFSKADYRVWMALPPLIGLLMLPFALNIPLGMDFTGGTEIQVITEKELTSGQFESALSSCGDFSANVQDIDGRTSAIIKSKQEVTKVCTDAALKPLGFSDAELQRIIPSTFKPELGKTLMDQGTKVFLISGVLMAIIIFVAFRSIIPSIAVIQGAVLDVVISMGALSLLGFELSLAGFAALIMLIGYSVDDNIVLTSNVLRDRTKPLGEQVNTAFATGMTMTGATIAALSAIIIVSAFVNMDVIMQIATVLLAGLLVDFMTTWFANVAILKWYISKAKSGPSRSFGIKLFRS